MDARVQKMIDLWIWYCSVANLGYDQGNRWDFPKYGDTQYAGECDCSSLMYHCAVEAGFNLPTSGTRYTGTMKRDFTNAGFKWYTFTNINDVPAGAILYKSGHTAGWTGHYICEAYGDEHGGSRGGRSGDQANETRMSPPRNGWEGYFYWPETEPPVKWPQEVEPMPAGEAVDYIIEEGSNNVAHQNEQQKYAYRYEKWASGKLVCLISDYFNGGTASLGSKYRGKYYFTKTLEFPSMQGDGAPEFAEPPYVTGLTVRAPQGWADDIQFYAVYKNKGTFWVSSVDRTIPKFSIDVELKGSWK